MVRALPVQVQVTLDLDFGMLRQVNNQHRDDGALSDVWYHIDALILCFFRAVHPLTVRAGQRSPWSCLGHRACRDHWLRELCHLSV